MARRLADFAEAEERRETIQQAAADFLGGEWSLRDLRETVERDGRADAPQLWQRARELGWTDFSTSDTGGDHAIGVAELCAIAEETGRALAPMPLAPHAVASSLLEASGHEARGTLAVLAHVEDERSDDPLRATLRATESGAGAYRLDGEKRFVSYAAQAELIVISARLVESDAPALFALEPAGIEPEPLQMLDWSPCAELALEGIVVPSGALIASGAPAIDLLRDALALETLLRCAELVGVAAGALDFAVDYARERIAFGRPIGSFQAVQHKLVDRRGHVEVGRALYRGAASDWSAPRDVRDTAVSMAAFWALDSLRSVPEGALQVFGGIGYTWEHDVQFYLRRAATLSALLGERGTHRERVAQQLAATR